MEQEVRDKNDNTPTLILIDSCRDCADRIETRIGDVTTTNIPFKWRWECKNMKLRDKHGMLIRSNVIADFETFDPDPKVPKWCPRRYNG